MEDKEYVYLVFEGSKIKVFKDENKAKQYYDALLITNSIKSLTGYDKKIKFQEHPLI